MNGVPSIFKENNNYVTDEKEGKSIILFLVLFLENVCGTAADIHTVIFYLNCIPQLYTSPLLIKLNKAYRITFFLV